MVKKNIFRATAVILLLLIFFFVFLAYRSNRSYQYVIHQNAQHIVKINVDGIYKSIAFNFVQNPSYYLQGRTSSKGEAENNGISFPSNIFIFTVKGLADDTFIGSLPLSNISLFKDFARNQLGVAKFIEQEGLLLGKSNDQKLSIAILKKKIAFSFSNQKENTLVILKDILERRHLIEEDSELIKRLRQNNNHLVYLNGHTELFANFDAGIVEIGGLLPLAKPTKPVQNFHFDPKSSIRFYFNGDLNSFKKRSYTIADHTLNLDSIEKYHNGLTTFELRKTTPQADTTITYVYNDDFEKVAQVTVKTLQVPEMQLTFNGNGTGLAAYLTRTGMLSNDLWSRKVFPLYAAYASYDANHFSLSTTKTITLQPVQESTGPFYLQINFDQLRKIEELKILNPYLTPLKALTIATSETTATGVKLKGNIEFKNKAIHPLVQLR